MGTTLDAILLSGPYPCCDYHHEYLHVTKSPDVDSSKLAVKGGAANGQQSVDYPSLLPAQEVDIKGEESPP